MGTEPGNKYWLGVGGTNLGVCYNQSAGGEDKGYKGCAKKHLDD